MSRLLGRLAGKLSNTKFANKLKNKYADQFAGKLSTSSFSNLLENTPFGNNIKTTKTPSTGNSSIKNNKLGQVFSKHKTKIATFIIILLILLIPLYLIIFKEILKYDRDGIQHTSPQNFYYIANVHHLPNYKESFSIRSNMYMA